jgi:serine/threonine protein kinase
MAATTTDSFLEVLRKSKLVPEARLEAVLRQANRSQVITPRQLAGLLIGAGLLTQFQAQQVLLGKHRGFEIGKYKVLERLGAGGSSTIYLCEHTLMRRRVAVKVLPTARAANPALLARFYREARASGLLNHPNLVRCHDIDCEGALHFLVMDYVDGASLHQLVNRGGPLSVIRACHYIRQAAQGLQHAHEHGLVHRDIKPANIMVDRTGLVKVLDLGLARFFHDDQDVLTAKYADQNILGTADYVAPEQTLDSHAVDIRADIYSLGATFYFILTGQPLFPEGNMTERLLWHQMRMPDPVNARRPEVPPALAAIVMRMLAKAPTERYQIPAEVVAALEPWTRSPIAPPAAIEMPTLCPAARQAGSTPGSARSREASSDSAIPAWQDETPRRAIELTEVNTNTPQPVTSSQTPTTPDATPEPVRPSRGNLQKSRRGGLQTWQLAALIGASMGVGLVVRLLVSWLWR